MLRPPTSSSRHAGRARTSRARRLRTGAALVALVLAALVAPGTLAHAATDPAPDGGTEGPAVVVVGTTGLRWDDVHTLSTPALWDLSRSASIGTVAARSIRSSACPADGWLALSAGARAGDLPGEAYGECRTLLNPLANGAVPGWSDYVASAQAESYDPVLGLLGEVTAEAGVGVAGFGPGAAIALAGRDGVVMGEHRPLPATHEDLTGAVADALTTARLVVVDAGSVRDIGRATVGRPGSFDPEPTEPAEPEPDADEAAPDPDEAVPEPGPTDEGPAGPEVITEPTRHEQVDPVDARVGAVLDAVRDAGEDVTVLVVSLADSGTVARMQLAAAVGPAPGGGQYGASLLESRSTRQDGILQATDLAPTVLSLLGLADQAPTGALVGAPVTAVPGPDSANARFTAVLDIDQHSVAVRPITPRAYTLLIVMNLVLYAVVSLGLNGHVIAAARRTVQRLAPHRRPGERLVDHPRPVLHGLRTAGVAVASFPVATMLANLTPWWRAPSPGWALAGLVVGWVVAVSCLALLPRWRNPLLGPVGVVAGATALVLLVDVMTGAALQVSGPLGVQPVVAGRFYGFNNTAFALVAAATILSAVAITDPLVRAGRRRLAAVVIAVIGAVVTVINGMPGLGSDFGGPPALVPGFAVLALMAAGIRLTWVRLVAVLGGGAAVVIGFAVLDWLRPAEERTHLGRFVDTVLDGGLWNVVARKLAQNLANLGGTWLTLLALGGIALVALVLSRPLRSAAASPDGGAYGWLSSGEPLSALGPQAPMLRPGVLALALTLGIGFAVNDSGIVIPALGISLAVPLLVAVSAGWLLRGGHPGARRRGAGGSAAGEPEAGGTAVSRPGAGGPPSG